MSTVTNIQKKTPVQMYPKAIGYAQWSRKESIPRIGRSVVAVEELRPRSISQPRIIIADIAVGHKHFAAAAVNLIHSHQSLSGMGNKRKIGGKPRGRDDLGEGDNNDAKLHMKTFEDVADSEDEFHVNRDKILLDEGPAQKKQRRVQEEGHHDSIP